MLFVICFSTWIRRMLSCGGRVNSSDPKRSLTSILVRTKRLKSLSRSWSQELEHQSGKEGLTRKLESSWWACTTKNNKNLRKYSLIIKRIMLTPHGPILTISRTIWLQVENKLNLNDPYRVIIASHDLNSSCFSKFIYKQ